MKGETSRPLLIQIDLASPTPVYRQIADAIRAHLAEGRVAPGDYLPTVRRLATDLAVHHNTVAQAYRVLADEGWLDLRRHHGARVQSRPAPAGDADGHGLEQFAARLRELVAIARTQGLDPAALADALQRQANNLNKE